MVIFVNPKLQAHIRKPEQSRYLIIKEFICKK